VAHLPVRVQAAAVRRVRTVQVRAMTDVPPYHERQVPNTDGDEFGNDLDDYGDPIDPAEGKS
jgi:hypothetical protein